MRSTERRLSLRSTPRPVIVDLSDLARPLLAGSWSVPGTTVGDEQPWPAFAGHTMVNTAGHTITIGVHGVIRTAVAAT